MCKNKGFSQPALFLEQRFTQKRRFFLKTARKSPSLVANCAFQALFPFKGDNRPRFCCIGGTVGDFRGSPVFGSNDPNSGAKPSERAAVQAKTSLGGQTPDFNPVCSFFSKKRPNSSNSGSKGPFSAKFAVFWVHESNFRSWMRDFLRFSFKMKIAFVFVP